MRSGLALGKAPAQDNDAKDITVMLDTNCKAVAVLTKAVAEGMIARNSVCLCASLTMHPLACCGLPLSTALSDTCMSTGLVKVIFVCAVVDWMLSG